MKMLYDSISINSYTEVLLGSYLHPDSYYVASNIEVSVNQSFSLVTALNIPNVKLYNSYVWFEGDYHK